MRLTGVSAASPEGSDITINARPDASRISKHKSVLFSISLIGSGIALLLFALFAAIYAARSRLTTMR